MSAVWDDLLAAPAERKVRAEVERVWTRHEESTRVPNERIERAWAGLPPGERDVLALVWSLRHALENRIVLVGSTVGLVLRVATKGTRVEHERAAKIAARAARALARDRASAAMGGDWVAARLGERRIVAAESDGDDPLRVLAALVAAARLAERDGIDG